MERKMIGRALVINLLSPFLSASVALWLILSLPALRNVEASGAATITATSNSIRGRFNGKIVFTSDRHGSGLNLWTMNPDGSSPTRLTDQRSHNNLPSFVHVYDGSPAWSPDGTKIAFVSNRDNASFIYTMNADGSNLQILTDRLLEMGGPAWSPDGRKIAFVVSNGARVGLNKPSSDIYAINSDGTGLTKILSDSGENLGFTWSPDGTKIAFASNRDPDGRSRIWVMDSDGSNQRRLTDIHDTSNPVFYSDLAPSWSPDGTKILFVGYRDFKGTRNCSNVNCSELFVMNSDGTNDHAITDDPNRGGIFMFPKWSPDGTKIVTSLALGTIADVRNGVDRGRAIIVMNADGSLQTNISNRGKYDFNSGEYVFFDAAPDWQPLASPPNFSTSVVGFSSPSYTAYEDARSIPVTVKRTGDLNAVTSCFYATFDGTATAQRDYAPVLGTLRFASGETSKTISVPIINNGDARGSRSFKIVLSDNEGNATFIGGDREATVTILDRDTVPRTRNPIDNAQVFVRAHYVDFLNREPDQGGSDYWINQITDCASDASCILARRVGVSAAFFIEQEFQQTGSFVIRCKLINQPYSAFDFLAFLRDVQEIEADALGQQDSAARLEANKQAYIQKYFDEDRVTVSWGRTDAEYVDLLFYYVQLYGGVNLPQSDRDAYVAGLSNGTETRATIFRKVVDHPLYKQSEYNPSFVLMQYYGYLRREPDAGGYQFWLDILNSKLPNDSSGYRAMVCAFLTSSEYQQRFSSIVTHGNAECGS